MDIVLAPAAAIVVVAGLALELRLFAPGRTPRRAEAIAWSAFWVLLAVAAAAAIAIAGGPAGEWSTVYLIERSLSLDNVFLFSLLLAYFLVPPELRGRVIVIGIAGALVLRALAITGGLALIESVEAVVYVFGALLVFVAYRALRGAGEESDPATNPALRVVRRTIPTTDDFRGRRLFVREGGRLHGTPLLLVVVAIIAADVAFAVDSIPAAFSVTHDAVVIWTANAFALLGLASLLALVDILVARFRYIDETIALILGFVGLKILLADVVHIGDLASLGIIAAFLAGGVVASLIADRIDPPHPVEEAMRRPPRCPRELRSPLRGTNVGPGEQNPADDDRGKRGDAEAAEDPGGHRLREHDGAGGDR
jgi:tellurite resistance protein TerC